MRAVVNLLQRSSQTKGIALTIIGLSTLIGTNLAENIAAPIPRELLQIGLAAAGTLSVIFLFAPGDWKRSANVRRPDDD